MVVLNYSIKDCLFASLIKLFVLELEHNLEITILQISLSFEVLQLHPIVQNDKDAITSAMSLLFRLAVADIQPGAPSLIASITGNSAPG